MAIVSHVIGTTAVFTGFEYVPSSGYGASNLWRALPAADGRVLVVYPYLKTADKTKVGARYRQTNGDLDTWTAETQLNEIALDGDFYAVSCVGCMDASDNAYVAWSGRTGNGKLYFCKFTKAVGGGWTPGAVVLVNSEYVEVPQICRLSSGRIVIIYANLSFQWWRYTYSDDNGATWSAVGTISTGPITSAGPCAIVSIGANALLVFRNDNAIVSGVYDGTTWTNAVLYNGADLIAPATNQDLALIATPGHANASAVLYIVTGSDGHIKLRRYKSGAWQAPVDTGVVAATAGRLIWHAGRQRAFVFKDNPDQSYDPSDDSLTAMPANFGWFAAMSNYTIGDRVWGFRGSGAGGTSNLTLYEESYATTTSFDRLIAIAARGGFVFDKDIAIALLSGRFYIDKNLAIATRGSLAFDRLIAFGSRQAINADKVIAIYSLPANFVLASRTFAICTRAGVAVDRTIAIEGLSSAIQLIVDRVIALETRQGVSIDRAIAIAATTVDTWIKATGLPDVWVKEVPLVDTWAKAAGAVDEWTKS